MIEKFGICLEPLTLESAMLVRAWRNSPKVNRFMDFKAYITLGQQERWFEAIVTSTNVYFIIRKGSTPIGLIHLNRFDTDKKTAYAGLFIGDEEFEGTGIAFKASVALLEYAFEELKLDKVFAKVHKDNAVAIDYNKNLGFEYDGAESGPFQRLKINSTAFIAKRSYLLNLLTL
ncbi:GNAT family N-acetyltransferase [Vicingaceae bacterium]|nr:GNAT family N-acetyltransferase [Vicingaceae bacterium]MDC1452426.1 GNAT family N-acetyltransferase [Vicingaceae bacterium]|tara:strand:- start:788 stop:1309 length:522 start_codon:yes stop_codon:yes gene_type:complete